MGLPKRHLMMDERWYNNTQRGQRVTTSSSSVWRRSVPKDAPPEPFKHLIDRYQHPEQLVTCTCGWIGSSSDTVPDGWKAHLLEVRGPSR